MATLTIRSVPKELHTRLKGRARRNRRSLNAETVLLLEQALETLPDEAALRERLRTIDQEGARISSIPPHDTAYETGVAPVPVIREAAAGQPVLEASRVLRLFAEERERLRSLGVRRIGLFGSVLRGESRPHSDVDVLVEFDPTRKSFDALVQLAEYLEGLLGRRVELLTTEGLSPYIGPKILQEAEFVSVGN